MTTAAQTLSLEEFLKLPETKPASEFIKGEIIQKPMPQGEHSRLQAKLCTVINQITEAPKIAYAFPELRCTFGGDSIIPDLALFSGQRVGLFEGTAHLPIPNGIELELTVEQVFGWLTFG